MKAIKFLLGGLALSTFFITTGGTFSSCVKEKIIRDAIIKRDTIKQIDTV
jgi:hypothetical protein